MNIISNLHNILFVRWWGSLATPNPRHPTVSDDHTFDPRDPFSTPSTQTQGTNTHLSVVVKNDHRFPEAKFLVPDWGIYVFDYVPQSGNKNFATEHKRRGRERSYERVKLIRVVYFTSTFPHFALLILYSRALDD